MMEIGHSIPSRLSRIEQVPGSGSPQDVALRKAAQALEANFLSEMLKTAGFGKPQESMGGGIGEDQFSSFLVTAQAQEMVKAGGIGLAENLFLALKARADE